MKIQDIGFFALFVLLVFLRRPKLLVVVGLISLLLAMPLFYIHIFFTAERLTWYAGGFILSYIIIVIASERSERGDLLKRLPRRPSTTLGTPRNDRKK